MLLDVLWLSSPEEPADDGPVGIDEGVLTPDLDPKTTLFRGSEGLKILPPVVFGSSKMLPSAVWLEFSDEPSGGDLAETDADVRTLRLDPKMLLLGRGEEVVILVLL